MAKQKGSLLNFLEIGQVLEVTVWRSENDEEGITFTTHIKELSEKKAILHPPPSSIASKVGPYLTRGTVLGVVSYGRRGQIIFYPDILYELSDGLVGYCVRLPDEYEPVQQRRRHVRVVMRIPVKISRFTGTGTTVIPIEAKTQDLSGGGMRFDCDFRLLQDEIISIILRLSPQHQPMTLSAKVVACEHISLLAAPKSFRDCGPYVTTASFTNLSEQEENAIVAECFRREIESVKKD